MYRIRRFAVVRTATVIAVLYAIFFTIILVPIALLGALAGATADDGGGVLAGVGLVLGVVIVLFVALLYAAVGWVFVALACLLYNLAARWVGGIEVQVEAVPQVAAPPVSGGWGASATLPAPPAASPPPTGTSTGSPGDPTTT